MELRQAQRSKAKIKMGLQGPAGSGKTKSSLYIAYGLCGNWEKIGVIDTENNSADLYADLGPYKVLPIAAPFTTEKYIHAINHCITKGMEVVIIDSISHEWDRTGGILEIHSNMQGNSFTNWHKITPLHNDFIQAILQAPVHIIATIRSKQDYILTEKNGKQVPEKVGLKGITRDGMDYEVTLMFDMDMKNLACCSKDRTGLFMNKPAFKVTTDTGKQILDWCNAGISDTVDFTQQIKNCDTVDELLGLFMKSPEYQQSHLQQFTVRRQELSHPLLNNTHQQNFSTNGI